MNVTKQNVNCRMGKRWEWKNRKINRILNNKWKFLINVYSQYLNISFQAEVTSGKNTASAQQAVGNRVKREDTGISAESIAFWIVILSLRLEYSLSSMCAIYTYYIEICELSTQNDSIFSLLEQILSKAVRHVRHR